MGDDAIEQASVHIAALAWTVMREALMQFYAPLDDHNGDDLIAIQRLAVVRLQTGIDVGDEALAGKGLLKS